MGIFSSHLMKLYQFLDDFAWADGGVNRRTGVLEAGCRIPA